MRGSGIVTKSSEEIEAMRAAGRLLARTLAELRSVVEPGVATQALDALAESYIRDHGGIPSFLGVPSGQPDGAAFPASICASINDVIVHGIPNGKPLLEGDIISVDCGVILNGWHSDAAVTLPVGEVSDEAARLIDVTQRSLTAAIAATRAGGHLGDVGAAVQRAAEAAGFSVVRRFVGHGIGRSMHEAPQIPNFGTLGTGSKLIPGMTLAIEPMVNTKVPDVKFDDDGWTARTRDGELSAHFEHTVAVTAGGAAILTAP